MTRLRRTFLAWNVCSVSDAAPPEPLLSVLLDGEENCLHVVRGIQCYVWESYDGGGNVILSRENSTWLRELVGTVRLGEFGDLDELRDELTGKLFHAVVGTSRLPLTSVQAPLPAFSFGQLLYLNRIRADLLAPAAGNVHRPMQSAQDLLELGLSRALAFAEKIKLLETWLHAVSQEELPDAAGQFVSHWRRIGHTERQLPSLLIGLFQEVSLTPCTGLVEKALAFVGCLEAQDHLQPEETADFLTFLLRLTARHLTAYDLVTFHHFGANFPDALLLDLLLKEVFLHCARRPDAYFSGAGETQEEERRKRLRRRGVRQGCLIRSSYEGHPVPDQPTSQGENLRVLPPSHPRVPPEQIVNPLRRVRKLFQDDPLAGYLKEGPGVLLRQALQDLQHPHELRELGMALFLDRPLGSSKAPIEPDDTPLLSYEAFSRSIARRRLMELADRRAWIDSKARDRLMEALSGLEIPGLALDALPPSIRPAPASLDDARKVAEDFVFLRTTRPAAERFFALFDLAELRRQFRLESLGGAGKCLIVRDAVGLAICDEQGRKRVELAMMTESGCRSRAGVESPTDGLRVTRVWEDGAMAGELLERHVCDHPIRPRFLDSL